ncbi:hypothetical protein BDV33DRAFT_164778 [Aspergillus novoparasiticus]|uniref:Uncharacterized protein n=1 Tax=Aspergillus novoparasiticus TaxID=986946 RepID=A0A5N6F4Q4_9EURO|nr:hypothetical protein BDV33DRAFT_164778 [Aspergillus novoparasiticus]
MRMEMTSLSQTSGTLSLPLSSIVPSFYFPFCVYTIPFYHHHYHQFFLSFRFQACLEPLP